MLDHQQYELNSIMQRIFETFYHFLIHYKTFLKKNLNLYQQKYCRNRQLQMNKVSEYKEVFDVADYSSKMFNMFSGASDKVRIMCDLELREQIMDRFGAKVPLLAYDSTHFETTVEVAVSDGLVSWLMSFGNKAKVLEPQYLADAVKERAQQITKLYE